MENMSLSIIFLQSHEKKNFFLVNLNSWNLAVCIDTMSEPGKQNAKNVYQNFHYDREAHDNDYSRKRYRDLKD